MQLYWSTDEALVDSLIGRAEASGAGRGDAAGHLIAEFHHPQLPRLVRREPALTDSRASVETFVDIYSNPPLTGATDATASSRDFIVPNPSWTT